MTLLHDEVNARLLELVYGEAAPSEKVALEAHVATCAACQAELAALGDTRARLRTSLDDAPVPARAHARILEAAAQAVAPAVATAAVQTAPARAVAPTPGPSWWERLRGRWTFPTFATVGAIAVVLIASKVFLEPQRTVERGREAMAPATPAAMPPRGAPEEQKPTDEPRAKVADLQQQDEARRRQPPSSEHAHLFGPGPGAMPFDGALMKKRLTDARSHGAVGGLRAGSGSVASPSGLANEGASTGGRRDEERATGAGLDDLSRAQEPAAPAAGYARPPSGWKGGAAAPEPAPAPAAAAAPPPVVAAAEPARVRSAPTKEKQEVELDEDGASADAFARRHVVADKKSKKAEAPAKTAVASSAPATAPAPAKDDAKESEAAPTQEALARRAEQLFAARRWSEAIAAYRELLRRFPDADLKSRWRARITSAEAQSDADAAEQRTASKRASKARPAEAVPAAE